MRENRFAPLRPSSLLLNTTLRPESLPKQPARTSPPPKQLIPNLFWTLTAIIGMSINLSGCSEMNKSGYPEEEELPIRLQTTAIPEGSGAVSPDIGEFEKGEYVRIQAVPADGFAFKQWVGDHSGTENPDSLRMDGEKHIVAEFIRKSYPLEVEIEGLGQVLETVVELPAKEYEAGTQVRLLAEAAEGWEFGGWDGDMKGTDNPAVIMISGEMTVKARFSRLAVDGESDDKDSDDKGSDDEGSDDEVAEGDKDTDGGMNTDGDESGDKSGPDKGSDDKKGKDDKGDKVDKGDKDGKGGKGDTDKGDKDSEGGKDDKGDKDDKGGKGDKGDKDDGPGGKDKNNPGNKDGNKGNVNDGPGGKGDKDKKDDNKEVVHYTLERIVRGQGIVWWEPYSDTDQIPAGTQLRIGVNPAEGWEFSHWEGSFQGRNKTVDATINRNTSVIAVFVKAEEPEPDPGTDPEPEQDPEQDPEPDPKLETVVLSFDTSNFRGGQININGETTDPTKPIPIEKGVEVQLEALPGTPQPAFLVRLFRGWRGDLESDENPLTLTMDSDLTIYPLFEDFLEIKPKVVGEGEIILHTKPDVGDNLFSLEKAEAITAEAVPAKGWEFVRWGGSFGNGQETENPATRQLVIAATGVLEAIFEKKTEYVSVKN